MRALSHWKQRLTWRRSTAFDVCTARSRGLESNRQDNFSTCPNSWKKAGEITNTTTGRGMGRLQMAYKQLLLKSHCVSSNLEGGKAEIRMTVTTFLSSLINNR